MSDPRLPYTVKAQHKNGSRTFLCPTAKWALQKLKDFERSGYAGITVEGPTGANLDATALAHLIAEEDGKGSAPIAPNAVSIPTAAA